MKPKIILKVIVTVLIIISIGFGITIFLTFKDYQALLIVGERVDKIKTDVFLRRLVADDYLLHRSERAREQWRIKQEEINQFLSSERVIFSSAESDDILTKIETSVARSQEIFDQIVVLVENNENVSPDNLIRLSTQLTSKAQETISLASELSREITARKGEALNTLVLLFTILVAIYFLFLAISFYMIWRSFGFLQKIDQMKSEFVSVASHQLRTPLTGIKWFAEHMLRGKAGAISPDQKDFLEQIHASNERMIGLVEDLLNVSRIETGRKFEIVKKPADLVAIIDSLSTDLAGMAGKQNVSIEKSTNVPKEFTLPIDADKLRQVFGNLLSNAVKYSKTGGKILINLNKSVDGKTATFSIKDDGLGIPAAEQGKMFQKFFRASNVQTKATDGTGLGLYIAKAIVEGHGGKLTFTSKENTGTTFFVELPTP